jgi:hypothetical protein
MIESHRIRDTSRETRLPQRNNEDNRGRDTRNREDLRGRDTRGRDVIEPQRNSEDNRGRDTRGRDTVESQRNREDPRGRDTTVEIQRHNNRTRDARGRERHERLSGSDNDTKPYQVYYSRDKIEYYRSLGKAHLSDVDDSSTEYSDSSDDFPEPSPVNRRYDDRRRH